MTTTIAKAGSNEMIQYTQSQVDLIKRQIAPKASPDELQLFLYVAKRSGLDPLTKQVYCIHRRQKDGDNWIDKMTIQTSIDGFRVIAQRSGEYAGQDEPEFIYDSEKKLICVKIRVHKWHGQQKYQASVGVAFWDEYVPLVQKYVDGKKVPNEMEPSPMWKKMPHNQLAKVAEALALRKAFPQDLSGIYTSEEFAKADAAGETIQTDDIQIPEDEAELEKRYEALRQQYMEYVGPKAAEKYHVLNWKGQITKKKFVLAIAEIERLIAEEKTKKEGKK